VVRSLGVVVALLVLAVGCDSDEKRVPARIVVSAAGGIGKLHVDQSDRAAVIAFVGKPDAERRSVERGGSAPYDALGYDCGSRLSRRTFPLVSYPYRPPYCRTIFWIDVKSGRLENFFTTDGHYSEAHGIRIGMATAVAERILYKRLTEGCEENIYLDSAKGRTLTIAFTGGVIAHPRESLHVIGGHVYAFVLHSRLRDAGVFDCL
jgi:hypothetical protein